MDLVKEGSQNLDNYGYDALSRKSALTYLNNAGSGYTYHADSVIKDIVQGFTGTAADVTYSFGYNKANQVNNRNISNISYVFNGFADEGTTTYTSNGLNQYEDTEAAPPLTHGYRKPIHLQWRERITARIQLGLSAVGLPSLSLSIEQARQT